MTFFMNHYTDQKPNQCKPRYGGNIKNFSLIVSATGIRMKLIFLHQISISNTIEEGTLL